MCCTNTDSSQDIYYHCPVRSAVWGLWCTGESAITDRSPHMNIDDDVSPFRVRLSKSANQNCLTLSFIFHCCLGWICKSSEKKRKAAVCFKRHTFTTLTLHPEIRGLPSAIRCDAKRDHLQRRLSTNYYLDVSLPLSPPGNWLSSSETIQEPASFKLQLWEEK